VLQLPAFDHAFIVECDTSGTGFDVVLHQDAGPLAFFSWPFMTCHHKLAAYERKLVVLVHAVRHWDLYLWGCRFVMCTDHFSLKFLLDQWLSTIPQNQWISKLSNFNFMVGYHLGHLNIVADTPTLRDKEELAIHAPFALTFALYDALYHWGLATRTGGLAPLG
jgi:hypothetical protein